MTWMQFINYLVILYLSYYAFNILMDLLRNGVRPDKAVTETVYFPDDIPEIVTDDGPEPESDGPAEATGVTSVVSSPAAQGEARAENPERTDYQAVGGITDSGGVELKDLFDLCRAEAIEYQRAITF